MQAHSQNVAPSIATEDDVMKLSTKTYGDGGRHIGLIHGLGADGETWRPLIDLLVLNGAYTVTTVDLRGHGLSDRAVSYSLGDFSGDIVEALPKNLECVIGHSLGGSVLFRAVERLKPKQAIYLDPGFQLALPTRGLLGRLFWSMPVLTMGVAALLQARRSAKVKAMYDTTTRALLKQAKERFDTRMAIGVFREVAFHPIAAAKPQVPSVVVLSDDYLAVLPDYLARALERKGWTVRRIVGSHHDMHLESPGQVSALLVELFNLASE